MRIRETQPDDADAIAALCRQLGYPATPERIAHRLGLLGERPEQAIFVAEDDDERVIGWLHIQGCYTVENDPYALVSGLVVDERMRGRGTGRALMKAAEQWAEARGFDEVRLRSNRARDGAHTFYRNLGYEDVKTSLVFRKAL